MSDIRSRVCGRAQARSFRTDFYQLFEPLFFSNRTQRERARRQSPPASVGRVPGSGVVTITRTARGCAVSTAAPCRQRSRSRVHLASLSTLRPTRRRYGGRTISPEPADAETPVRRAGSGEPDEPTVRRAPRVNKRAPGDRPASRPLSLQTTNLPPVDTFVERGANVVSHPRDDAVTYPSKQKITLNGGSLGSWVDEERS